MSKHEVTVTRDDVDGSDGAEEYQFEIDGDSYELDLNSKNRMRLDKALAAYELMASRERQAYEDALEALRTKREADIADFRDAVTRRFAEEEAAAVLAGRPDANAIRRWCAENGIAVAPRGPISLSIIDQFKADWKKR